MDIKAKYLIEKLNLVKHPEGGHYAEVYRSEEFINKDHLPERYNSQRSFSTSIYFLLESDDFSAFNRVNSDEIWHFYAGTALTLFIINDKESSKRLFLEIIRRTENHFLQL